MNCPQCGYVLDAFDKDCPRCHGKGLVQPPPSSAPNTSNTTPPSIPLSVHSNQPVTRAPPNNLFPGAPTPTLQNLLIPYLLGMVFFCTGYFSPWISVSSSGWSVSSHGGIGLESLVFVAVIFSFVMSLYERQSSTINGATFRAVFSAIILIFAFGELIHTLSLLSVLSGSALQLGFGLPLMFLGAIMMFVVDCINIPTTRRIPLVFGTIVVIVIVLGVLVKSRSQLHQVQQVANQDASETSCLSNLRMLALVTDRYSLDNDEKYPDLSSPSSIRAALENYTDGGDYLACPLTKEPYLGNPSLSGKSTKEIADAAHTILFYDADAAHSGGRDVAYADGTAKWLSHESWLVEKQKSDIP